MRNVDFCHPSNGIWYLFDAIFITSRGRMMGNIHHPSRFYTFESNFHDFAENQKTH